MPFFSIIIPVFNRGNIIGKTLETVIEQTFDDWECIIVDDGSTDNTAEVIKLWTAKDHRFKYIYQANAERSAARNNGAQQSNSRFLIFLDSDDLFENSHLQELYNEIKIRNEIVGLYFTGGKVQVNGKIQVIENTVQESLPIDFFLFHPVIPGRVCLHKDIFKTFEFDLDSIVVEDTVLWTEILDKFPVFPLPLQTVIYNIHDDNSVNLKKYNAFKLRLKGLKKLFEEKEVGSKISVTSKKKLINQCFLGIAKHHRLNNRHIKNILFILKALIWFPSINSKEKIYLLLQALGIVK